MPKCPYKCGYEAKDEEDLDEHINTMIRMDDPEHGTAMRESGGTKL